MHWQNMWTDEDNARLLELDKKGVRVRDIAIRMNKSKNAVAGRLHRIRIKNGHTPKYKHRQLKRYSPASQNLCNTDEDNARLIELDKKGVRVRDIAIRMNKNIYITCITNKQ